MPTKQKGKSNRICATDLPRQKERKFKPNLLYKDSRGGFSIISKNLKTLRKRFKELSSILRKDPYTITHIHKLQNLV